MRSSEDRFYNTEGGGIGVIMEWLQHHKDDDVWKRAAGIYIQILSRPELYIEGNHRTGALIMSYILASEGQPPFVLTVHNASAFLNSSALAKTTRKTGISMLWQMPRLRKRFTKLIRQESHKRYLLRQDESDGTFGYDSLACKR